MANNRLAKEILLIKIHENGWEINAANSALGMFDWAVLTHSPSLVSDTDVGVGAFVVWTDVVRNARKIFASMHSVKLEPTKLI